MLDLNGLLQDSGLGNMIKEMNRINRFEANQRKQERLQRESDLQRKLFNGTNFTIDLYYKEETKKSYEEISLEGYDNFKKIVTLYREIGFNIGLRKITINLDDKKVHSITFKY